MSQSYTLTVSAAGPLTLTTTSLPAATVGSTYDQQLAASGGIQPYTWLVSSGSLPAGLYLDPEGGELYGTPTTAGTSTFTVEVTDSSTPTPKTVTKSLSLTVTESTSAPTPQSITFTAPSSGTVGGTATLSATGGGSGNPVVFSVDSSSGAGVCAVSGTNGATLTYTAAGSCVIDANQAGSASYGAAPQVQRTIAVGEAAQSISFTAPSSGTVGGTATLSAKGGGSGNPVVFSVASSSGKGVCAASGTNGTKLTYTAVGSCVIDANQAGSANYLAAPQVAKTIAVGKAATRTSLTLSSSSVAWNHEKATTFTVTVSPVVSGTGTPTGTVKVTEGKTTLCSGTLSKDKATCTVGSATTLAPGSYSVSATYAGNATLATSTSAATTAKVTKEATTAKLALSASSATDGHEKSLVFTVTVTAQYGGTPVGTITITAGKTTVCKNKSLSKGKITCTLASNTTLGAGTYTVTASYAGNADYVASSSSKSLKVIK